MVLTFDEVGEILDQLAEQIISDYNGSISMASLFVDDNGKLVVECI